MFSDGPRYHALLISLSSNLSKLTNQVTSSRPHPDSLLPTGPINTQITPAFVLLPGYFSFVVAEPG
jgi:hypothetical protein